MARQIKLKIKVEIDGKNYKVQEDGYSNQYIELNPGVRITFDRVFGKGTLSFGGAIWYRATGCDDIYDAVRFCLSEYDRFVETEPKAVYEAEQLAANGKLGIVGEID